MSPLASSRQTGLTRVEGSRRPGLSRAIRGSLHCVIFPTNIWEYDVLNVFPFASERAKALAAEARRDVGNP